MYQLTDNGRVLTALEIRLCAYLDSERQAVALAQFCHLSSDATDQQVEDFVCDTLAAALTEANGKTAVLLEYVSGCRRDQTREAARLETSRLLY
ncbi:MAG: hypothetical protein ACLP0H_21400 [Terriglobales bacterium]